MPDDPVILQVDSLAKYVLVDLPKIYGPNALNGPSGPPPALVAALEQLETAAVNPDALASGDTVASAEERTLTDLQALFQVINLEAEIMGLGPLTQATVEVLVYQGESRLPGAIAAIEQDATVFAPPVDRPPLIFTQPPPANGGEQFAVINRTSGLIDWENGQSYTGPVGGITNAFISLTPENLDIIATAPNNFIHTGDGTDGISVSQLVESDNKVNVLDGGGGANFLVGSLGGGTNHFYLDDRNPSGPVISTVVNLHQGDDVTVWGVNATDFSMIMADNNGAPGYTGLEISFAAAGHPNADLVIAGYASSDLGNGKLNLSFGSIANGDAPGDYALITAGPGAYPFRPVNPDV